MRCLMLLRVLILPHTAMHNIILTDYVQGSAMDALQSMEKYLATRPTRFPSLASGIEWQYAFTPIHAPL